MSSTSESPTAEIQSHSSSLHLPSLLKSMLKSPPIIMFSQSYDLHSERISAIMSMNSSYDSFLLCGLQGIYTFITKKLTTLRHIGIPHICLLMQTEGLITAFIADFHIIRQPPYGLPSRIADSSIPEVSWQDTFMSPNF